MTTIQCGPIRSVFIALCAFNSTVTCSAPAHAVTINMTYTDEGSTPPHPESPSWDPDGSILIEHFRAAEAIWEGLLPGGGEYEFDFHWDDDVRGLATAVLFDELCWRYIT